MNSRSALNQVKIKVRREVLLRRHFTVAEIVGATGLNPESVRTELQRMKEQELLTSERQGKQSQYHITADPEKRLALSQSLYAFDPSDSSAQFPMSDFYQQAKQCLDNAMSAPEDRPELIEEITALLDRADGEQGVVSASEGVLSYMGFERARLAYLMGKAEAAARSFQALRPFFESVNNTAIVQDIEEFLLTIKLEFDRVDFASGGPGKKLREYIHAHRSRGPLLPTLANMLDHSPHVGTRMRITAPDLNPAREFFGSQLSPRTAALAA